MPLFCEKYHKGSHGSCSCQKLINIGNLVLSKGVIKLSNLFKIVYPTLKYHSVHAKKRILQLPLVTVRVGDPITGLSETLVFEYCEGFNYERLHSFLLQSKDKVSPINVLKKDELHNILSLAQSDRERELIKYTAFRSSGLSATAARRKFGLDNISARVKRVEDCVSQGKELCSAIDELCSIRTKAVLTNFCDSNSPVSCDSEYSLTESDVDLPPGHPLKKTVLALQRKCYRKKRLIVAQRKFLNRRSNTKGSRGILRDFPSIGSEIEKYVKERSIGADAWRRTGILTFDGNKKEVKDKVTYEGIRQHLQLYCNRNISFGTVVQLCCARNKRHRSAKRYRGVAQVVSKRSRKGFELRYNPDSHWSNAFYRGLAWLQYSDGSNVMNLNRDDASGFRLDTLASHRQYRTPVVKGHEIQTTHTDYVKNYPSTLHTTSYNFTGTNTTAELCAGVVKAAGVIPKNPAQHHSDLTMLTNKAELQPAFFANSKPKQIECIRVDGAMDEGPSHLEVQFWWTKRHLELPTHTTLVTARNSGASYLNRVELQNGCLSIAHANLFIPSNLNGSCFDTSTGKIDKQRLKANMDQATKIYIDRVNHAPFGSAKIHLYPGAESEDVQVLRGIALKYLKGNNKQKKELGVEFPDEVRLIREIWSIRCNHSVKNLPDQYCFMLQCCFSKDCSHPICQKQHQPSLTWFPEGPPVSYVPIPVADPNLPWGSNECTKCKGHCNGHFLTPEKARCSTITPMCKPPSTIIKEAIESNPDRSDNFILELARKCLLPIEEVRMWIQHLSQVKENRKRGAKKAAMARRARKGKPKEYAVAEFCGVCKEKYEEVTEEVQRWISCDNCGIWIHFKCAGLDTEPDTFSCNDCSKIAPY